VMADRYIAQDRKVFSSGKPLIDNLDLTLYGDRLPGWCLTTKLPLFNRQQDLIGLACISKDLIEPSRAGFIDEKFAAMIDYVLEHCEQPLLLDELAARAELSVAQLDRRMKKIFHISTGQFIIKTRIDAAAEQLRNSDRTIADIALDCGFCDQSALTRQFRQVIGLSPGEYRKWAQPENTAR
jgi:AraC-like DNA-binding protein